MRENDDLKTTCKISHGYSQVGTQASRLWHCDTTVGNLHKQTQCFQITNDLYFLTITCRPLRSFFLFPFCFIFIYSQNYTPMVFYEEIFLCTSTILYITNSFCICIETLSLHVTRSNPIYIQSSFSFFSNAHLWFIQKFLYIHSLFKHTRISLHIF